MKKMKKILLIALMVVLTLSISITVFANTGTFQNSPSASQGPELISGTNDHHDCIARLIITSYANRNTLSEEKRLDLENVYQILSVTDDISTVIPAVKDVADKLNISTKDLAATELFDISLTECPYHELHSSFDVLLKADTLRNFVCLLHYYNGEWEIIEDVEVIQDKYLAFTESDFSPFVIVTNPNGSGNNYGVNGNYYYGYGMCCCCWWVLLIVIVIAIFTIINFFLIRSLCKKKKAEEAEEDEAEVNEVEAADAEATETEEITANEEVSKADEPKENN